jgi:hypothetical protein
MIDARELTDVTDARVDVPSDGEGVVIVLRLTKGTATHDIELALRIAPDTAQKLSVALDQAAIRRRLFAEGIDRPTRERGSRQDNG